MIIRDVSVKLVEAPLSRVFRGSTYQVPSRCTVIVRLETDDGVVGEIYSGDERTDYHQIRELILGEFREAYIGEDPVAVERIWDRMFRLTPYIANKAVAMQAISAIDLAVWDLIGKALDTPVHRLLGGCKSEIPIIGYTYFEDGTDTAPEAELVLSQKEQGYAGTKLKVGDEVVARDVKRVEDIRRLVGDDFILACDANRAWTVDQALYFARNVADLNVAWLEEPVRWQNEVDGMRRVRESTAIPVTAGQSEMSGFGCMGPDEGRRRGLPERRCLVIRRHHRVEACGGGSRLLRCRYGPPRGTAGSDSPVVRHPAQLLRRTVSGPGAGPGVAPDVPGPPRAIPGHDTPTGQAGARHPDRP